MSASLRLQRVMRIRLATSYLLASLLSCVAAADDQTVTDLADAVEHQNVSAVVRMLAAGTDVNASQDDGMTALHWAVYHDNA
ncbi:MAG: ankyrin repeat domain-containing protein, partial [Rubripirellula sp.]